MRLYSPGGASGSVFIGPSGTRYEPDSSGAILVTIASDIGAAILAGFLLQRAVSNLASIRQRDRLLLNNNGALIAAPVWATGVAYKQGQLVRYSATNPALIGATNNGTSGASLATYTANGYMSDGVISWAPVGRVSCAQATASTLVTSLYKEIPTIGVSSTSPGTTLTNLLVPGNVTGIFPVSQSAAAGKASFPVTPWLANYGTANTVPVIAPVGSNVQNLCGGGVVAQGWNNPPSQIVEFITDAPAPTLYCGIGMYLVYVGDPDGSNMTLIEESPSYVTSNPLYYTITWPTGRKARRYRVESLNQSLSTASFNGIYTDSQSTVWAPPQVDGVLGITLNDSFGITDASGASAANLGAFPFLMGVRSLRLAGVRYAQSIALTGAGYVAGSTVPNSTSGTLQLPVFFSNPGQNGNLPTAQYLAAFNANLVVFTLGFNDVVSSAAKIQANALASFNAARAIWPNAVIIVFSSQSGAHNGSAVQLAADGAISAAFSAFGDANSFYFPVWLDPAGAWITGTGNPSAPTGVGNADFYSGTDGTHPTISGHEYISQRMSRLIDYALTASGL
jgi:hypothetical protein